MKLKCFIFIMLLFIIGCAPTKTQLITVTGMELPTPSYAVNIRNTPITVVFYYDAQREIVDLDGYRVIEHDFLKMFGEHDINIEEYKSVALHIEVNNPTYLEYNLKETISINDNDIQMGGMERKSNLRYRHFVYDLPIGDRNDREGWRNVIHSVIFGMDGESMLRMHFRYTIVQEGGDKREKR